MLSELILAISLLDPSFSTIAEPNVRAAINASSKYNLDPELLLAMAFIESRFNPSAVSRLECTPTCKRVTGPVRSIEKPKRFKGTYFCGVLQVTAKSWKQCIEFRDNLDLTYETSAKEINEWMQDPYCRKRSGDDLLKCALYGYGGGYAAVKSYSGSYPSRVIFLCNKITRLAKQKGNS